MERAKKKVRNVGAERLMQRKRELQGVVVAGGMVTLGSGAWGLFATPTKPWFVLCMVVAFVVGAMFLIAGSANAVLLALRCAVARYRRTRHARGERFAAVRSTLHRLSSASIDAVAHWLESHRRARQWFWLAIVGSSIGMTLCIALAYMFGRVSVSFIPGWAIVAYVCFALIVVVAASEASIRATQMRTAKVVLRDLGGGVRE
ncbi:hypothetical protein HY632_05135 [Candidatus Uhrbacteria bacterium]|nr:hypothetical protein [Candidatus Uhrbacteria bacterium]